MWNYCVHLWPGEVGSHLLLPRWHRLPQGSRVPLPWWFPWQLLSRLEIQSLGAKGRYYVTMTSLYVLLCYREFPYEWRWGLERRREGSTYWWVEWTGITEKWLLWETWRSRFRQCWTAFTRNCSEGGYYTAVKPLKRHFSIAEKGRLEMKLLVWRTNEPLRKKMWSSGQLFCASWPSSAEHTATSLSLASRVYKGYQERSTCINSPSNVHAL